MFPNEPPDSPKTPSHDVAKIDASTPKIKTSLAEEFRESLLRVKEVLALIKKPLKK